MNNYSGVRYSQMQLRSKMLIKYVLLFMETMNLTLRSKKITEWDSSPKLPIRHCTV